ncbi:S1 family peptidase [Devriesea agamarum]|uniref:S1 family peptidase n=1 Tax=Devriesea agamarum TaxID=472569 RepID=UPI00071C7C38|nr:S1 family peptidase [Devriesea agamarum]
MKITKSFAVAAGAAAIMMTASPALASPGDTKPQPSSIGSVSSADAKTISSHFTDEEIGVMAKSSGRSVSDQKEHVVQQARQNNAYAKLHQEGYRYDGAFFGVDNNLVVQASEGSSAAEAAREAGLVVRAPKYGEKKLDQIVGELAAVKSDRTGVSSVMPDVTQDKVVVTVFSDKADPVLLEAAQSYGDAVTVVRGEQVQAAATVHGGDKMLFGDGGYCSAGFPATAQDGTPVMVWAGHCVNTGNGIYTSNGSLVSRAGQTAFHSYDGQPDRDLGYIVLAEGTRVSTDVNKWGVSGELPSNASQGTWKAPIGTDTCKSGATTGITCGPIRGYNTSVTYTDKRGNVVAQVSGLGVADICVSEGDSGGAYTSNGYAVGMTSGSPQGQGCRFNGGYVSGWSYFQPINDALNYYGLSYGYNS